MQVVCQSCNVLACGVAVGWQTEGNKICIHLKGVKETHKMNFKSL